MVVDPDQAAVPAAEPALDDAALETPDVMDENSTVDF